MRGVYANRNARHIVVSSIFIATLTTATQVQAQTPQFTVLPIGSMLCPGDDVSINPAGSPVITINFAPGSLNPLVRWQHNGQFLVDGDRGGRVSITTDNTDLSAVTTTLTLTDTVSAVDAGLYRCWAETDTSGVFAVAALMFEDEPSVTPTSDPESTCEDDTVLLSANPQGSDPQNQTVTWVLISGPNQSSAQFTSGSTGADVDFTPTATGTYVLRAETVDPLCNQSALDTLDLEVFPKLTVAPLPPNSSTCVALDVPLTANPSGGAGEYEYQWSIVSPLGTQSSFLPNATVANPSFHPTQQANYTLAVFVTTPEESSTQCVLSETQEITVNVTSAPTVEVMADNEMCVSESMSIDTTVDPPQGVFQFSWVILDGPDPDPGQLADADTQSPTFMPTTATEVDQPYRLQVTVGGPFCSNAVQEFEIVVFNEPDIAPAADQSDVCAGHSVQLAANPTGSDMQSFFWSIDTGPDGGDAQFDPTPTVENPTFSANIEGTYVVKAQLFEFTCENNADNTLEIIVHPGLTASPTPTTADACIGSPVALTANPSGGTGQYQYAWTIANAPPGSTATFSPDNTTADPSFSPTHAGQYILDLVVSAAGCDDATLQSVTVNVSAAIAVIASSGLDSVCVGNGVIVSAQPGTLTGYTWSVLEGPDLSSDQFVSPNQSATRFDPSMSGDYVLQIEVTSGTCPSATDTLAITALDEPSADPDAERPTICLGENTPLSVVTGGGGPGMQNIQWSILSGPDTSATQLTNPTTATPTFTPTQSTTPGNRYVVGVSVIDNTCNTKLAGQTEITVNPPVDVDPQADPPETCVGVEVTLTANATGGDGDYVLNWIVAGGPSNPPSTIDDPTAEETTFTPLAGPGTFTLALAANDENCNDIGKADVQLSVKAPLTINPDSSITDTATDEDQVILNESTTLHANPVGGTNPTYTWTVLLFPTDCTPHQPFADANVQDPEFTAECTGTYRLTLVATDSVCGVVSEFLQVESILFTAQPTAAAPDLCTTAANNSTQLDAGIVGDFSGFDFAWTVTAGPDTDPSQFDNTDTADPTFTPAMSGAYTLQVSVSDPAGLLPTVSGQTTINVAAAGLTIDQPPDPLTVCVGEEVEFTVTAQGQFLSYQWRQDGIEVEDATTSALQIGSVVFTDAGLYTCVVSNGCESVTSTSAQLTVDPPIDVALLATSREDAILRGFDPAGCIYDGDLTDVGTMGENYQRATGLAKHPQTGVLYASLLTNINQAHNIQLVSVNPVTGTSDPVDTGGNTMMAPIEDIAFHPDGTLYAVRTNDTCVPCIAGQSGELYTVDLTTGQLAQLDPPFAFGDLFENNITFDENGTLYHQAWDINGLSRLSTVNMNQSPLSPLPVQTYPTFTKWASMAIRGDLFLAARRAAPSELWQIDLQTFSHTVLGPIVATGNLNRTITGMILTCSAPADGNCDGNINLEDFAIFVECQSAGNAPASCAGFDFNFDGTIDLVDWSEFQLRFGE